jgi:hypothetical protein
MDGEQEQGRLMRYVALTAVGDFILLIGLIFVFLGISGFISDFLKVKGSGEFLVGIVLVGVAFALIMRSRPAMPAPQEKEGGPPETESYR